MFMVTALALSELAPAQLPPPGLKVAVVSEGSPVQVKISGSTVMLLAVLTKPVLLLTVIDIGTVAPAATENVAEPVVGAMVKLSFVAVTVRFTIVDSEPVLVPLAVPVTVIGTTLGAVLTGVEIVSWTF